MLRLYGIYDARAEQYIGGVLQLISTDASAIRMFGSVIGTPGTIVNEHPHDFELHGLGEMDINTGVITPYQNPRQNPIATGTAVLNQIRREQKTGEQLGMEDAFLAVAGQG